MTSAWCDTLKVGDVITNDKGPYRVIRRVGTKDDGSFGGVMLSIRHCSWTRRPYTCLNRTDLKYAGYRLVRGAHWSTKSEIDQKLLYEMERTSNKSELTCCAVAGLP